MESYDRFESESGSGGTFVMGLLAGTVLGASLGMLFAPKSGSELRSQLSERAGSLANTAKDSYNRATEAAQEGYKRASDAVSEGYGKVADVAQEGYRRASGAAREGYKSATEGSGSMGSSMGTSGTTGDITGKARS